MPTNPDSRLGHGALIGRRGFLKAMVGAGVVAAEVACQQNPVVATARWLTATPPGEGKPIVPPVEPTPSPTEAKIATPDTEPSPPLAYEPPTLAEAAYADPVDQSQARKDLLDVLGKGGFTEKNLKQYEEAVFSWVDKQDGWSRTKVKFDYVKNDEPDGKFRWGMVLRDAGTNDLLWTKQANGALSTYPTVIGFNSQNRTLFVDESLTIQKFEKTG